MFGMSPWHIAVLLVAAMFIFGPDRLPHLLRDLGKALRQVRQTAESMQEDLKAELGPEVGDLDLRSLHPKTFVEKHLFGDEEDPLGLDFLTKDPEPVSFDKQSQPAMPQLEPAVADAPAVAEPASMSKLKYDADAT